jgi:hypothetical protein
VTHLNEWTEVGPHYGCRCLGNDVANNLSNRLIVGNAIRQIVIKMINDNDHDLIIEERVIGLFFEEQTSENKGCSGCVA